MEHIIEVEHLKKYYRETKAVDDISFSVKRGELFGFLGVNGAGKSTTVNILCTMQTPTEGTVHINGLDIYKDKERIKRHIGVVYQNNCLDKRLTVYENLMCRGNLYENDLKNVKKTMDYVAEILELQDILHCSFGKLSGGQKRRCEIARALMHTLDILFLDEPTTGLDPATRKSVWETIGKLQSELKMTVFLTTHYMEEAAKAEHIGIIDHGHLVEYGTPFSLKEKYAKDKLYLIPWNGAVEGMERKLQQERIKYIKQDGRFLVKIENTLAAMPILERFGELLEGFEVIQGTMDDVFLNVSDESIRRSV